MDVNNLGVGGVNHCAALGLHPPGPCNIFKPGKSFIVRVLLPQAPPDRGVGIVAEWSGLVKDIAVGIPLSKDLVFGEAGALRAALLAVDDPHVVIFKRTQEMLNPVGIDRIDVGTGNYRIFCRMQPASPDSVNAQK